MAAAAALGRRAWSLTGGWRAAAVPAGQSRQMATASAAADAGSAAGSGPAAEPDELPKVAQVPEQDVDFMRFALPKSTANLLTAGGRMEVMERAATAAAVDSLLSSAESKGPVPRIALGGARGTGKSVGLASIARQCRAAGWIVAYVPDASTWCDELQSIEVSKRDPNRLDQYDASARWLSSFLGHNGKALEGLPVAGSYTWDTPLKCDGLDTIHALATFGVEALDDSGEGDPSVATDVVGVVLKELSREDLDVPVLVAVDVYNAWAPEVFPKFRDFDNKAVDRERASLIRHFRKITESASERPLGKGGVVVAESDKGGAVAPHPLGDHFSRAMFEDYTEDEFHAMVRHFAARGYIPNELSSVDRTVLELTISSNPRQFRKHISAL